MGEANSKSKIENHKSQLLSIWLAAEQLAGELESLDKIEASRRQRAAIGKVRAQFRWWRNADLGELLNLYDLPPEKRESTG